MWIELTSALIDYAVGGGGVMTFVLCLVSIPLLEYAVYRWLRKPYLKMSHLVRRGWLISQHFGNRFEDSSPRAVFLLEKELKTTPCPECSLNALSIDEPLEYAHLYLEGYAPLDCFFF